MAATLLRLALASLWNRRLTAGLTLVSITLAVVLLLGVEKIRSEARDGFYAAVSGTDLIVGARAAPVQLLLASVFRIGDPPANLAWDSYERVRAHPQVAWSIPLTLGDSHRGYRVLGTDDGYLAHFRHGRDEALAVADGVWFDDLFDAVIGAEVAASLAYAPGTSLVLAHGAGPVSFSDHATLPFRVSGVLAPTGTPVDRTIHVSLAAIEAIHLGWEAGIALPGREVSAAAARAAELRPEVLSAALLGLRSRVAVFPVQQYVNGFPDEPLTAIMPAVALQQFFALVGTAESALLLVSAFVVLVGLAGMMTVVLASLTERRREMAILRSVGARPLHVLALLVAESATLTLLGVCLGFLLVQALLVLAVPALGAWTGIRMAPGLPGVREWALMGGVLAAGVLVGVVPALLAYRRTLADGLSMRL
ncbi:MAG TPA: ABC transporter permease [Pseudomonadales bacterium]|nr:ABC transporter permease [Pseudomonadales bacterium]